MGNKRVVFASRNAGKVRELRQLLAGLDIELVTLDEVGIASEIEETGATFAENALIKARFAAEESGLPAIADDSGLEVDALHGAPGVRSARYAGEGASHEACNRKLLSELEGVPAAQRSARFRCAVAFIDPEDASEPTECEGTCEGRILAEPSGLGGFGYDPLFYVEALGQTFAQADPASKNRLSHRGQALRKLVESLGSRWRVP